MEGAKSWILIITKKVNDISPFLLLQYEYEKVKSKNYSWKKQLFIWLTKMDYIWTVSVVCTDIQKSRGS